MRILGLIFISVFIIGSSFASEFRALKDAETYVRSGPGSDYPIVFKYKLGRMPVKILKSHEGFSQIIDYYGNKGWIVDTKLKRVQTAFVFKNSFGYKDDRESSDKVFEILAPNVVYLNKCSDKFCKIELHDKNAYILKSNIWGNID